MQALLLKNDVWPLHMEIKSNCLYYRNYRLMGLDEWISHRFCTFVLCALFSKNPVLGRVTHGGTPTIAWVGITFTSGLDNFELGLFTSRIDIDWQIETIANGKRLWTHQDPFAISVTLKHQTVELLLSENREPEVLDLNNQEQRSLILDLLAIDHPVFREFVQLIKA